MMHTAQQTNDLRLRDEYEDIDKGRQPLDQEPQRSGTDLVVDLGGWMTGRLVVLSDGDQNILPPESTQSQASLTNIVFGMLFNIVQTMQTDHS